MEINLDENKEAMLFKVITEDQYRFSNNVSNKQLSNYNKLCAYLDRTKESVFMLNNIELHEKNNFYCQNFIMFISYADLLISAIWEINKIFNGNSMDESFNWFSNLHNKPERTDHEFFRFIRAIILPHALKLDADNSKCFTNDKTAYCPSVKWHGEQIRINYYNDDFEKATNTILIKVKDIIDYVKYEYNKIDDLIEIIIKAKSKAKNKDKSNRCNEKYSKEDLLIDKCKRLIISTKVHGDVNDERGVSGRIELLEEIKCILEFKFNIVNCSQIKAYKEKLNLIMDEYFDSWKNQEDDLGKILRKAVIGLSFKDDIRKSVFDEFEEDIKIILKYKYHGDCIYRQEIDKELIELLSKYVQISDSMSDEEVCYLIKIAIVLSR